MTPINALVMLAALLVPSMGQGTTPPDLNGNWTLVASSSTKGPTGEHPVKTYVAEGWAFNCGRECRIVHKGSRLTVESAQLTDSPGKPSPTVTFELDGKPHSVTDSVNVGQTLEATGRWEDGKLMIITVLLGRPIGQTVSLEKNQLVVVTSFATSDAKLIFRYEKK